MKQITFIITEYDDEPIGYRFQAYRESDLIANMFPKSGARAGYGSTPARAIVNLLLEESDREEDN